MSKGLVTVFGGSGFVGKHVVRALVKDGWRVRVPMRRPHTGQDLRVIGNVGQVQLVQANIRFKNSVERAIEGSDAVVNLVAVLHQEGKQSFRALHEVGAATVAEAAHQAGIHKFRPDLGHWRRSGSRQPLRSNKRKRRSRCAGCNPDRRYSSAVHRFWSGG